MQAFFYDEPELEFGGGRHIDIRYGLSLYGALDARTELAPKAIRLGLVGDRPSIDEFVTWVDRCRSGVDRKRTELTTLFPAFPGFGENGPFCDIICDGQLTRSIPPRDLKKISKVESRDQAVRIAAKRYSEDIEDLFENTAADLAVCLLSPDLMMRVDISGPATRTPRSRRRPDARQEPPIVWHDLLKAESMRLKRPIQVVRPGTYGGKIHRYRRDGTPSRDVEDEATRAWNLFTAVYYKAGGIPWRMCRRPSDLDACYVGVSFYHERSGDAVQTSVAQVFNERGEGVVVRGGSAQVSKEDRTLHLSEANASALLSRALSLYKREHGNLPARAVCHKSTYFDADEKTGFESAAGEFAIDSVDLLSMRRSFTRVFRRKPHPPLRGSAIVLDDAHALLYTQGSVDFYRAYPGLYVPRPLEVGFDEVERGPGHLLPEILALTKMNWNSTRFVNAEPITLGAARKVGNILRYLQRDDPIHARYSYYM